MSRNKRVTISVNVQVTDPNIEVVVNVNRVVVKKIENHYSKAIRDNVAMLDPSDVIKAVCKRWKCIEVGVLSKSRKTIYVTARQMVFSILYKKLKYSLKEAGDAVGGKDHTTVLHSLLRHNEAMKSMDKYRDAFDQVLTDLKLNEQ